jgi:hypothetical protein
MKLIVDPENNISRIVKRSIEIMIEKFRSKKIVEKCGIIKRGNKMKTLKR